MCVLEMTCYELVQWRMIWLVVCVCWIGRHFKMYESLLKDKGGNISLIYEAGKISSLLFLDNSMPLLYPTNRIWNRYIFFAYLIG